VAHDLIGEPFPLRRIMRRMFSHPMTNDKATAILRRRHRTSPRHGPHKTDIIGKA
jgi:hypothetical protein